MTIRTALVGRGMAGTAFHAPLIRAVPELELIAWTGSADAAAAIASPDVDLVVVATPNLTHFPLAAAALEAGKHVVVDKPFTLDLDEADALIALAAAVGRVLTVFHNRRWDGDFLTTRALIEAGRLGALSLFEAHWDRFRPDPKSGWRETPAAGAGLLWDLGPHLVDQALVLLGRPDWVSADLATQRGNARVDDYFALTLGYGPMRARLSASTLVASPRPRFAAHGLRASWVKYGLDPQEAQLKANLAPGAPGLGEGEPGSCGILTEPGGRAETIPTLRGRYVDFYEGVADSIRRGDPPPVDPAEARAGLQILDLARRSALEGRRIPLPSAAARV